MTLIQILLNCLDSISCALLPAACALCRHPLTRLTSAPICEDCWSLVVPQTSSLCARCGEDLGIAQFSTSNRALDQQSGMPERCRPCEVAPPAFEQAVAFGNYEGTMRGLIHLLKYEGMEPLASKLGNRLAAQVTALLPFGSTNAPILVIPVPLHRTKQGERGFNQATLLAQAVIRKVRALNKRARLELAPGLLERRRSTESQAGLSTHQRRRNLRGAFFVSEHAATRLQGRNVLLIDDIYTTGATARACSQALRKAGAAGIWVATAARAQREGVARWDGAIMPATQFAATSVAAATAW